MNLRAIIMAFAATALAAHGRAEGKLRFAQITDAHLFDAGYNCYAPDVDIEQDTAIKALKWAVERINQENQAAVLDFVVITGDLGISNLGDDVSPPYDHPSRNACNPSTPKSELFGPVKPEAIHQAAVTLAGILGDLKVSSIYLLPGNNDVPYDAKSGIEDPLHRESYREFVETLSRELPGRVRDLSGNVDPASDAPPDVVQGYSLIGLDTASFKPSDIELKNSLPKPQQTGKTAPAAAQPGSDKPPAPCQDPDANSAISNARTDQLSRAAKLAAKVSGHFLLFTHIPDLQDPFAGRRVNGATDASKKCSLSSSWMLVPESRKTWTGMISNPKLVGVFAGHFHSADASQYGGPFGAASTQQANTIDKIYVAPPVSLKNQWSTPNPRRGLLIIDVQDDRVRNSTIAWYRGINPTECQKKTCVPVVPPAPSIAAWLKDLFASFAVAVLLFVLWDLSLNTR